MINISGNVKGFGCITDLEKNMATLEELLKTAQGLVEKDRELEHMKTFPVELLRIAAVLKDQGMPQATINMVLAARCGVPLMPMDTKSPYIRWTEDEPRVEL